MAIFWLKREDRGAGESEEGQSGFKTGFGGHDVLLVEELREKAAASMLSPAD